jgi:hypothetical protein
VRIVDDLAVALAILASVIYALLALGPRALRARLLAGSGALLLRLPRFARLSGLGLRLRNAGRGISGSKAGGACGGCDSCGSETAPGGTPGARGTAADVAGTGARGAGVVGSGPAAPPEVRIPLSKIGRR